MTNDALSVVRVLFQVIWHLFTDWHIPGTNVTPAGAVFFFLSAAIGLRFIFRLGGTSEK